MDDSRFANLREFAPDRKASLEGAALDLGGGRVVYVRQAGGHHRRFEHVCALRMRERGVIEMADELEQRVAADEVAVEVAAEVLIAGWDGLVDVDGQPVECTPEAALELVQRHPAIADRIVRFAYGEENFRRSADIKSD